MTFQENHTDVARISPLSLTAMEVTSLVWGLKTCLRSRSMSCLCFLWAWSSPALAMVITLTTPSLNPEMIVLPLVSTCIKFNVKINFLVFKLKIVKLTIIWFSKSRNCLQSLAFLSLVWFFETCTSNVYPYWNSSLNYTNIIKTPCLNA